MARILIIDDEEPIRFSLRGILEDEGYEVLEAATAEEGLEVADAERPDLVFLDIWLPGMDGLTAQARLKGTHPDLPVGMISGHGTIETAVSAIQQGAYDFIEKPLSLEKVVIVAARALEAGSLRRENQVLRTVLPEQDELIGQSPVMLKFQELLARVAPTDVWVLLTGENGTGKELAARALHAGSRRADAPMIAVNCAAIPEELIESELFGHEKGAFTSADQARAGRFEMANNGTLFLDGVEALPLTAQLGIVRLLRGGETARVGGGQGRTVNVRLIAGAGPGLSEAVREGLFLKELHELLREYTITVPPLRERRSDIEALAARCASRFAQALGKQPKPIAPEALDALLRYPWPGNVRELETVLERAVALAKGDVIGLSDLHARISAAEVSAPTGKPLPGHEAKRLLAALERTAGNVREAAKLLGISRGGFYVKLKKLGLNPDEYR